MSHLYEALRQAHAERTSTNRYGAAMKPVDMPIFELAQAIDARFADRPRKVVQLTGCSTPPPSAAIAMRLARFAAVTLDRQVLLLDGGITRRIVAADLPFRSAWLAAHYPSPKPAELGRLWQALRRRFDLVILDTPTLGLPTALAAAPTVDGVILVIGAGNTRRTDAADARDRLIGSGANLLGAILTTR